MSIHQPPESKPVEPLAERDAVPGVVPLAELLKHTSGQAAKVREIGGRSDGPEPTRYGDWEKNGRCIDF